MERMVPHKILVDIAELSILFSTSDSALCISGGGHDNDDDNDDIGVSQDDHSFDGINSI